MEENGQEMYEHYQFIADPGQKPLRIDRFLTDRIENASRNKIQEAASAGFIFVNDNPVKANYKVKPGDDIRVMMSQPPREIEIIPEDIPLDIVHEDASLIVVNKPAGLVVHPGYGNYTGTLVNALAWHFKDLPIFKDHKDPRPGLVHRIDKNTSGLLVIAKTEVAKTKLAAQFADHSSQRTYQALIWGSPKEDKGTIEGHIGRSLKNRKVMTVFPDGEYGKHAITHFKVLQRFDYVSLIECKLETGRTHQIRTHMKHIGHPIFNDNEYGGDAVLKGTTFTKYKQFVRNCFEICPRQALHAKTLGFVHPETKQMMNFDSDLPNDMLELLSRWENYLINRIEK
jgi:23S rRNA pseudouridine1911/1915/1917 synthase